MHLFGERACGFVQGRSLKNWGVVCVGGGTPVLLHARTAAKPPFFIDRASAILTLSSSPNPISRTRCLRLVVCANAVRRSPRDVCRLIRPQLGAAMLQQHTPRVQAGRLAQQRDVPRGARQQGAGKRNCDVFFVVCFCKLITHNRAACVRERLNAAMRYPALTHRALICSRRLR